MVGRLSAVGTAGRADRHVPHGLRAARARPGAGDDRRDRRRCSWWSALLVMSGSAAAGAGVAALVVAPVAFGVARRSPPAPVRARERLLLHLGPRGGGDPTAGRSSSTTCATPASTSASRPRSSSRTSAGTPRRRPTSAPTRAAVRRPPPGRRRRYLPALPAGAGRGAGTRCSSWTPWSSRRPARSWGFTPDDADRGPAGRRAPDDRAACRRDAGTSSSATRSAASPSRGT